MAEEYEYEATEDVKPYDDQDIQDYGDKATVEEVTNRTVLADTDYNGVTINDVDGIAILSTLHKLLLNATKGIEITKLADSSIQFYVDAVTGDVTFAGTLSGADGTFNGTLKVTSSDKWGANAAVQLQNGDITGLNGLYMKDIADNEGEGVLFLKNGMPAGDYTNAATNYYTLRVDGAGTLLLDGKPVFYNGQNNFLLDTAAYPADGSVLTPSRTLSNCPNGWIIVWSDFDAPSTAQNYNWFTTVVPKFVGDNGNNWSIAVPVGTSTGSYDTMAAKQITIYNDRIVGEAGNSTGISADVVLRYVIGF